ncbi:DUF2157 domain-containing protein [Chitinophaga sp. Cy-1792]|uniref:DUF2157 domain-containing protein n=1 Tax=Chitinophaga sp. Cy-1792 TaxID=2608339 RepID=UPI001420E49F|nr:DUF2157 domain-containing protein [Chitinophaga sp. Cy-1792]NIG57397.1 DUF2157 domain-containing protein [Chitinophaga sp. Cy-1792]
MNIKLFERLHQEGLISDTSFEKVKTADQAPVSVHWEIRTFLYLGVLLLSTGLGVLVYDNINTIGHQSILIILAIITAVCFGYCFRYAPRFSWQKTESPGIFYDYTLLLGCILFSTFIGYLQYQYNTFGNRLGLATFIPLLVLVFSAYRFDHIGVLSMAIITLAAWLNISVGWLGAPSARGFETGMKSMYDHVFLTTILGVSMLLLGFVSKWKNIKPHFAFTYYHFGIHLFGIGCIAGMFSLNDYMLLWFLILTAGSVVLYKLTSRLRSGYLLAITILYFYIGFCTTTTYLFEKVSNDFVGFLMLYVLVGAGLIAFVINQNKKFKNAGV